MPVPGAVLLLAYGGPGRPEEIRPFLDEVLRGKRVPRERYEAVVRHYEEVGGASPLLPITLRQAEGLAAILRRDGPDLPVRVGMRHWHPFITDTLAAMAREGIDHAAAIILAPHPSEVSRESYLRAVEEGRVRIGGSAPEVAFAPSWHEHPLFIETLADRLAGTLEGVPVEGRGDAVVIFTAHSIPVPMDRASGYSVHVARTAELVARRAGLRSFRIAYQSRSGGPADPWLGPDVTTLMRELGRDGARDAIVVPAGFVADHVEVLWDLDIDARAAAQEAGVRFHRAPTAGDHPAFLRLLADLVRGLCGTPA
jgi:ferrochelatase